nr:hypothetical protein GCM10025699_39190 [Microbacterium flavescens]
MSHVESLLSSNQKDVLMEEIIANYHANTQDAEVVLVKAWYRPVSISSPRR